MLNNIAAILGGAAAAATSYEFLASFNNANGAFTSIPQTYKHLQIRLIARDPSSVATYPMYLRFNSDTGSNYRTHYLNGDGASATAGTSTGTLIELPRVAGNSATSGIFGAAVIDILDYTNTNKYKVSRTLGGSDNNGAGNIALNSGLWLNTAAITTVDIGTQTGNAMTNSTFALYGIKG